MYPALSRQSTPRGEPLCCKQLAQMPLSQVMIVRAGVVTLCAEGLLKLWARPSMPPPLPAGGTRLARKKVRGAREGSVECADEMVYSARVTLPLLMVMRRAVYLTVVVNDIGGP